MKTLSKHFPKGLEYRVIYNPTEFIAQSIDAVVHTLFEAIVLVVLVIIVFLQKWRAAIIPVVAIPVSLIGTFAVLAALGYSLNNLSLFGLVLAIGIVVDDAIVVVENVERNLERGLSPAGGGARPRWTRCRRALIAIVLVLCAVFVPTLFLDRPVGRLLPAVRGDDLGRDDHLAGPVADAVAGARRAAAAARTSIAAEAHCGGDAASERAGDRFNRGFERLSDWLCRLTARLVRAPEADDAGLCRADRADRSACSGSRRPASSRRRTRAISSPSSSCRRARRSSAPMR